MKLVLAALLAVSALQAQEPRLASSLYRATLRNSNGELEMYLTIEAKQDQWSAYSRANGAAGLASGAQSAVGGLLGKLPAHGALMDITDGVMQLRNDSLLLRGSMRSPVLGNYFVRGAVVNGELRAELG